MNGKVHPFEVFRQLPLNAGQQTNFLTQWPLGLPYHWIDLLFEFQLTSGATAGTTPVADGNLAVIKGISFWTPKNEYIFNNVPGRWAYLISLEDFGATNTGGAGGLPNVDAVTIPGAVSSSAVSMRVLLRIPLSSNKMYKGSDFILDTSKYSNLNLSITIGNVSDMMGVINNTTFKAGYPQLSAYVGQEDTPLPAQLPAHSKAQANKNPFFNRFYPTWFQAGMLDPTVNGFLDIPRSEDLSYLEFYAFFGTTATAGQFCSGTPSTFLTSWIDFSIQTEKWYPLKNVLASYLLQQWQASLQAFSAQFTPNAWWKYMLPRAGQKQGSLYSGDKSQLRLTWTQAGLAGAGQLSVGGWGWRAKPR
jgi:hypothetical protein